MKFSLPSFLQPYIVGPAHCIITNTMHSMVPGRMNMT